MRHLTTGLLVLITMAVARAEEHPVQSWPTADDIANFPLLGWDDPTFGRIHPRPIPPRLPNSGRPRPGIYPPPRVNLIPPQSITNIQTEYAKVEKQREVLGETFATIEDARKALDQTYAPKAVILYEDHLLAVGPKDFLKLFWMGAENSRLISVDHKLNFDGVNIVETFKLYRLKDGKSTAWIGERFWNKIDGVYKITYASYKERKELLKEI